MLSLSVLSASVLLPFVRFPSASGYLAFCFFLSSFFLFPPHSGFLSAPSPLSLPWLSPFLPTWFPVSSLPVLRTRLSVRFLSSFPVSLPQPFHRCFPPALAFGLSPSLPFSFVHFRSGSNYSAFRSFLSLLPVLPCRRFLRCFSPLPSGLFPCLPSDSGTQLPAFLFALAVSPHSGYLSALAFSLSVPGLFPLAFALGSGYSALRCILSDTSPSLRVCSHLSDLTYTIMAFFDCQHLF